MRYTSERKQHTRENILRSAQRLFAAKGFAATSIDDIMHDCQLTRGGFYAHFKSKGDLYRTALALVTQHAAPFGSSTEAAWDTKVDSTLDSLLHAMLRDASTHDERTLAFLATDATCDDPQVRSAYVAQLKLLTTRIETMTVADQAMALSTTAMIVGTMVMANTVDDAVLARKLKDACLDAAKVLLENSPTPRNFFWEAPEKSYRRQDRRQ